MHFLKIQSARNALVKKILRGSLRLDRNNFNMLAKEADTAIYTHTKLLIMCLRIRGENFVVFMYEFVSKDVSKMCAEEKHVCGFVRFRLMS